MSVPAFRRQFGYMYKGEPTIPADWLSAFSMISSVGQFFGGFLCSVVADRVGRRWGLAIGVATACGGIFGEIFSAVRPAFLISKLILGVGLGFFLTIGPLYCSEVCRPPWPQNCILMRQRYLLSYSEEYQQQASILALSLGNCFPTRRSKASVIEMIAGATVDLLRSNCSLLVGLTAEDLEGSELTRAKTSPVFFAIGLPFSIESPWYLVYRNDIDRARHALQRLYGKDTNIEVKLKAIQITVAEERALQESKWIECFRGTNLIRTGISTGVFVCQHFSGIIFVLGFSTYFFELAGLPTSDSFNLGVGVTACGVVGTMLSWVVVNSFGRRKIFLTGMTCLTICLLLIGILDVVPTHAASWAQAALTVVYALIYQVSIGSVAFVLLGEVSAVGLRAKTTALATAVQSVFGIAMNVAVPYMVNPDAANMQGKVGFVFGGLALFATVVCFFYIPELKGRTFDEIDTMFARRVPPRRMGSYVINEDSS